jgi:hypothetical protein
VPHIALTVTRCQWIRRSPSEIVGATTERERNAMTHESYKAWLDEMPIADVRRRIDRLEKKLWDLHVLERIYDERHNGGEDSAATDGGEGAEPGESRAEGESPQTGD